MVKGRSFDGPFFEEHTGIGAGEQLPTIAREHSFGAEQEQILRNAQRLGIPIPPPMHAEIIRVILHPRGSQLLDLFLKNVFRSFQQHVRLPSHHQVPFRGTSIDQIGAVTLAPGADLAVSTFQIPPGHLGVIRGFGHDVDIAGGWNDITWSLRIDNTRFQEPYIAVTDQIATVLDPWRHSVIHVKDGRQIALHAVNAGIINYEARARLIGWYYPIRQYKDGYEQTLQE